MSPNTRRTSSLSISPSISPRRRMVLMTRLSALSVALMLVAAGFMVEPGDGRAQDEPDARAVAAAVQSFYNQTTGVRSNFHQTYYNKLYDRYDRSRGKVTFAKPGKMRWNYARPNGKIISSDGSQMIIFEPGDEGERGQCFQREMADSQLPAAFSFLTGEGRLEEDFTFRLLNAARQGYREGYVLELRPRTPSSHYARVMFYVMRTDGNPSGIVRRVLIVDPNGNRNRFDFSEMTWNPTTTAATFRYRPPNGVTCTRP